MLSRKLWGHASREVFRVLVPLTHLEIVSHNFLGGESSPLFSLTRINLTGEYANFRTYCIVVSLVARKFTWHYKVFRSQKLQKSVFTVLVRHIHTYRHHLATTVHGVTILIQIMLRLMKFAQISIPELRFGMKRFTCNTGAYELIVENCLAIL